VSKSQEGEYELVLGNHQLLGVFFIVVVLIAVFFAMGYLMGQRNAAPVVSADVTPHRTESKPLVVDSPAPASPAPDAAPQQAISTQPQTSAPVREPTSPDVPKVSSAPRPAPSGGQPAPGTYLQLSATTLKAEADTMVDVLRNKSFPALTAEIPERPGTYRVLVGPLADADVNKTRAALQDASFPGKDAIKKTF
jgi:cell division septation protein DedD